MPPTTPITDFFPRTTPASSSIAPGRRRVISLFDHDGSALAPWAERKYECISYQHSDNRRDWSDRSSGNTRRITCSITVEKLATIAHEHDGLVAFACANPPSNDLSIAGARHWKRKRDNDPEFQTRWIDLIQAIDLTFTKWHCPFYISHPTKSILCKLWKPPNYHFQPFNYGGFIPKTESHRLYPDIVPRQDAYTQQHALWTGGRFRLPDPRPVKPTWLTVRPKSKPHVMRRISPMLAWKARHARRTTPQGFALALCRRLLGEAD